MKLDINFNYIDKYKYITYNLIRKNINLNSYGVTI
jgi:hypothetical protein